MQGETGNPRLNARLYFQLTDTLLDVVKAAKGFAVGIAHICMDHRELLGDVLYAGRQPDDSITRLVVALADAHKAHAGHTDGSSRHCRKDFNHRGRRLPLYLSDLGHAG